MCIRDSTIVVPAREEGFKRVFIGKNAWYSIRLSEKRIPQIKYIAAYRTSPISAVTHIAEVKKVVPCKDIPSKYYVAFKDTAKKVSPIKLNVAPQGPIFEESSKFLK